MIAHAAIGAAIVLLAAADRVPVAAAAFVLAYVFIGIRAPLHETMLHRRVDGDQRSTMLSLDSLALQLGGVAGAATVGILAQHLGIPGVWMIVGSVVAVAGLLYRTARGGADEAPAGVTSSEGVAAPQ